ncbi:zinc finger BED domain-containing protein 4-like [Belonocnema kinseyi]|uniref:zinc finger BED domain-containing protein 4-like n=1 Tax=Belonocnema kinseyi TaxID=2817044 RepID=UPI00143DB8C7|nr:zinc finger BED domain-containing protein 4-like [Belonocnema kinseyi]
MFKRVKEAVKLVLSEVQWMSLPSDIWSCSGTHYSFISLTVHWLDDHFERRSAALNVDVFPGSHTGNAIADKLIDLMASWGLDKIQVHLLMRDNGGNMAKGCRVSDIGSEGCNIHTLQLVIKNTRWNSTFYLMLRFLELEICLDLFSEAEDNDSKSLTCAEWEILEELANLLQPFEEVTKSLSYNESCMSEVIPTIKTLHFCLSKQNISSPLSSFKADFESNLRKRFEDLESNINFTMSTFLDPRFKTVFFPQTATSKLRNTWK